MKLCADNVGWNCENEGNVRPLGEKDYALLNVERIVYISLVIITYIFLCCECFVSAYLTFVPWAWSVCRW